MNLPRMKELFIINEQLAREVEKGVEDLAKAGDSKMIALQKGLDDSEWYTKP